MKEFAKSVLYVFSIVLAIGIGMFQNEQVQRIGGLPPCDESIELVGCGSAIGPEGGCEPNIYVKNGTGSGKYGPSGKMLCEAKNCAPTEGLTAVECGG